MFGYCVRVLLLISALVFGQSGIAHASQGDTVRLAGAGEGSAYEWLFQKVASSLGENSIDVSGATTEGSWDNMGRLTRGEADFALVQQDVATEYLRRFPEAEVQVLRRVYYEYLHILVRVPLAVDSATAFRGMKVWAGNESSGSRYTGVRVLDIMGVPSSQYALDTEERTGKQLVAAFRVGELDVALLVTRPPNSDVLEGVSRGDFWLYSLPFETLRALTVEGETPGRIFHQMTIGFISPNTYGDYQEEEISSLAVPTLLMVRTNVPTEVQSIVASATRSASKSLQEVQPFQSQLLDTWRLADSNLPLAEVFEADQQGALRLESDPRAILPSLLILALIAGGVTWWRRQIYAWSMEHKANTVLLATLGLLAVSIIGIYFLERSINEDFATLPTSAWSVIIYVVSGFEERIPFTAAGRGLALMVILLGPILGALATAWFAALMIGSLLERGMPHSLENHVVILNSNDNLVELVKQLTHESLRNTGTHKSQIVVVAPQSNPAFRSLIEASGGSTGHGQFGGVWFTTGDPVVEEMLEKASVAKAKTVVVLLDAELGDRADEKNLRILFAIRRVAKAADRNDMHVVVEQLDAENSTLIRDIGEDFPGLVEPINGSRTAMLMLSQATLTPGIAHFYSDLLSVSESSELYVKPVPKAACGMSFSRYAAEVIRHCEKTPIIPLGLRRQEEDGRVTLVCNPKPDDPLATVRDGDELILISYDKPKDSELPGEKELAALTKG